MIEGQFFIHHDYNAAMPAEGLFEITYVTGGVGQRHIKGARQILAKGNYFLSEPGVPAKLEDLENLEVFRLFFCPSFLDQAFPNASTYRDLADSYLLRFGRRIANTFFVENLYLDTDGTVEKIKDDILREKAGGRSGHLEMIRCYAMEIILLIFRECAEKRNPSEERNIKALALTYDYCQKFYTRDIKLSDMCKTLHYSLPYLSARFKEVNGCTFTQLVQRFRVEEACRLILATNKKMDEISVIVGYKDVQTFYKIFRKLTGITPLQYRKQHGERKDL